MASSIIRQPSSLIRNVCAKLTFQSDEDHRERIVKTERAPFFRLRVAVVIGDSRRSSLVQAAKLKNLPQLNPAGVGRQRGLSARLEVSRAARSNSAALELPHHRGKEWLR